MMQGPKPHLHRGGQGAGAGAWTIVADVAHIAHPLVELREEDIVRWAREHYVPADRRESSWHPVILDEMLRKENERNEVESVSISA